MIFNSVHFLIFFPIVILMNFVLPVKARWIGLLVSSYYFYMSWNPKYLFLLLAVTMITYFSGILIERSERLPLRKMWVAISFGLIIAVLAFFKYSYFLIENVNRLLSVLGIQMVELPFDIILPIGISFYTLQALTYTMDVYRGEKAVEKNFARYALFVSFFPQILSGPIERSKNFLPQIREPHYFEYNRVKNGLLLMVWGFFKKLVISDRIAILVNNVYDNYQNYAGFEILAATLFFAFQIYTDFSSYSDIARGAAMILGFRVTENFKQPYFATSIREFWQRWHISLSTWFRDYLYIPLGGNRKGKLRKYRNIMLIFLASGLWHGASWKYIIWGGLHGAYQVIGDQLRPVKEKLYTKYHIRTTPFSFRLSKGIITFLLVDFAWIFFRANSTGDAFGILRRLFTVWNPNIFFDGTIFKLGLEVKSFILVIISLITLLVFDYINKEGDILDKLASQNACFRWLIYYGLILGIIFVGIYGADSVPTDFIYSQF